MRCSMVAESTDPWESLECSREGYFGSESRRALLLDPQGDVPLRRFTEIERPGRIQHTWMSPNTLGLESIVTLTFKKQGEDTLMTLVHSGLPDTDEGRGHEKGWNYFLEILREQFGNGSRKKYRWDEAHKA